jgi:hypothetical protein
LPSIINFAGSPQVSRKSLWQDADHQEKTGVDIFTASSVGELTGGEKLAVLLLTWKPLVKL